MNTTNILNKLKDFLEKHDYVKDAFPEILEKHNVTNIKSEFADKLDTITDPFERLIVGMHMVDLIDEDQADDQVLSDLNERHTHPLDKEGTRSATKQVYHATSHLC